MVKIEMENRELTKTQSFASKPVNGLKPLVENNVVSFVNDTYNYGSRIILMDGKSYF